MDDRIVGIAAKINELRGLADFKNEDALHVAVDTSLARSGSEPASYLEFREALNEADRRR